MRCSLGGATRASPRRRCRLRRSGVEFALALVFTLGLGCDEESDEAPAASASARIEAAPPPPRCVPAERGAHFTISRATASGPESPVDAADEIDLPFAVEIGTAVGYARGFAVGALRSASGGSQAVMALVDRRATRGRLVDLGRVYGNAEPPRVAARDGLLIAAVPDSDASGATLKLVALRDTGADVDLMWGPEVQQGKDDSSEFALGLNGSHGLLVWDELDESKKHSSLRVVHFDPDDLSKATKPRAVTTSEDDAEAPRLARRADGFWLSWVSRAAAGDADPAAAHPDGAVDFSVMPTSPRILKAVPLDGNGAPVGEPVVVSPSDAHVLASEVAGAADGSLLLAWRDDPSVPGAEARTVHLARVRRDGSVSRRVLEDEQFGVGVPGLFVDTLGAERSERKDGALHQTARGQTWLSVLGRDGQARLARLSPTGEIDKQPSLEPALRSAEPIAAAGEHLLAAQPRGMEIELVALRCATPKTKPEAKRAGSKKPGKSQKVGKGESAGKEAAGK